jgi:hypothetical protein
VLEGPQVKLIAELARSKKIADLFADGVPQDYQTSFIHAGALRP